MSKTKLKKRTPKKKKFKMYNDANLQFKRRYSSLIESFCTGTPASFLRNREILSKTWILPNLSPAVAQPRSGLNKISLLCEEIIQFKIFVILTFPYPCKHCFL